MALDAGRDVLFVTAQVGKGSRVAVATEDGTAYAADSGGGELWVLKPVE